MLIKSTKNEIDNNNIFGIFILVELALLNKDRIKIIWYYQSNFNFEKAVFRRDIFEKFEKNRARECLRRKR